MNFEIHEFCQPDAPKKPKRKITPKERARLFEEIISRTNKSIQQQPGKKLQNHKDPLDFIPNIKYSLEQTLKWIPNKTNKFLLRIVWNSLPYFQDNHNLILSTKVAFIRKALNPRGLIIHMHCEDKEDHKIIHGYYLIDNPFVQEIKQITLVFK